MRSSLPRSCDVQGGRVRLDVEAVPDQGERDLLVLGGRLPRVGLRGQVARVEVAVVADVATLAHRAEQAAVHQEGIEAEVVVEHRADPGVEVHDPALPGGVEPLGELDVALLGQHPALVEALAEPGRRERPVALGEAVHPVPGDRQRPAVDPDGDPGALAEVGPDAADPERRTPGPRGRCGAGSRTSASPGWRTSRRGAACRASGPPAPAGRPRAPRPSPGRACARRSRRRRRGTSGARCSPPAPRPRAAAVP